MSNDKEELVFTRPGAEFVAKVIVIGDPSVGKTSLLTKYSTKKFETKYIPTVGTNITKEVVIFEDAGEKIQVNLMLWDVAGQWVRQLA